MGLVFSLLVIVAIAYLIGKRGYAAAVLMVPGLVAFPVCLS